MVWEYLCQTIWQTACTKLFLIIFVVVGFIYLFIYFDLYILTEFFFLNKKADLTQGDGWGDRGAPGSGQH